MNILKDRQTDVRKEKKNVCNAFQRTSFEFTSVNLTLPWNAHRCGFKH